MGLMRMLRSAPAVSGADMNPQQSISLIVSGRQIRDDFLPINVQKLLLVGACAVNREVRETLPGVFFESSYVLIGLIRDDE